MLRCGQSSAYIYSNLFHVDVPHHAASQEVCMFFALVLVCVSASPCDHIHMEWLKALCKWSHSSDQAVEGQMNSGAWCHLNPIPRTASPSHTHTHRYTHNSAGGLAGLMLLSCTPSLNISSNDKPGTPTSAGLTHPPCSIYSIFNIWDLWGWAAWGRRITPRYL